MGLWHYCNVRFGFTCVVDVPRVFSSTGEIMNDGLCQQFVDTLYFVSSRERPCDVTDRAQGYTLQDATFMRQSRCSFLNA